MAVNFCQNLLPSLTDCIIARLTCSSCKKMLVEKVYHCDRGHSVCPKCNETKKICNMCGASFCGHRSHNIERILQLLRFPCKYYGNGCSKRCPSKNLKQHEAECQTVQFACPFRLVSSCRFSGTKKQIVFHCQLVHGQLTFVNDSCFKQQICLANHSSINIKTLGLAPTIYTYLYNFNDILFKSKVIMGLTKMNISMWRLSLPSDLQDVYEFVLDFYNNKGDLLKSIRRKCCLSTGDKETVPNEENMAEIDVGFLTRTEYFILVFKECEAALENS